MFRLRAVRHEPLGLDRYHTAYWFFADTSQLFCQSNDDKWGHLANPDEVCDKNTVNRNPQDVVMYVGILFGLPARHSWKCCIVA